MKNELTETITGGLEPQELRRELQEKQTKSLRRRRVRWFNKSGEKTVFAKMTVYDAKI